MEKTGSGDVLDFDNEETIDSHDIGYIAFKDQHGTNHVLLSTDIIESWSILRLHIGSGSFQLLLELANGSWAIYNDNLSMEPKQLRDGYIVSKEEAKTWLVENSLELPASLYPTPLSKVAAGAQSSGTETVEEDTSMWVTVSDAASASGANKGTISRAVNNSKLKGIGDGKNRRICPESLTHWQLKRAKRKDPEEDDEEVRRRLKELPD